MERGKARSWTVSAGSSTRIKAGAGTLYAVHGYIPNGGAVRVENTLDLGATPDLNAVTSNGTLGYYGPVTAAGTFSVSFTPGVGFDGGLVVAGTSNARVSVAFE